MCDGGQFAVAACPLEYVSQPVWELVGLADLWEKGIPPVAGGALDQTAYFVASAQIVFRLSAPYKQLEF